MLDTLAEKGFVEKHRSGRSNDYINTGAGQNAARRIRRKLGRQAIIPALDAGHERTAASTLGDFGWRVTGSDV